jgi:hypothetical protein
MGIMWREFAAILLTIGLGAAMWFREQPDKISADGIVESSTLYVWHGSRPVGNTWSRFGASGGIRFAPTFGVKPTHHGIHIICDGSGNHQGGLNWKGWYPDDACDDVSAHNVLLLQIKQKTKNNFTDLGLELMDNIKRGDDRTAGNTVRLVSEGLIPKIDGEWRQVIIPLDRFTRGRSLDLKRLWGINFVHQGSQPTEFIIDQIGFATMQVRSPLPKFPEGVPYEASVRVRTDVEGHRISDRIYGLVEWSPEKLEKYRVPITRWGGNTSSRYNWKINADNGAKDWFFKNRGKSIAMLDDNAYLKQLKFNQPLKAGSYLTLPMLGWVAKDHSSYSYPVSEYGPQQGIEPNHSDVGNGITTMGRELPGEASKTSTPAPPEFVAEAVKFTVGKIDPSNRNRYWVLDNEPMLWNETHRDVRPEPLGYDELWDRTVRYAEAIRSADPGAKIAGYCSWGWTDLVASNLDKGNDNYVTRADSKAHGGIPMAEWFIKKCGEYKQKNNRDLVDVFDFHWYPQARFMGKDPYTDRGMDLAFNQLRLRTLRELWDPTYQSESWVKDSNKGQPVQVIRRIKGWIEKHNPGMELCLGEYNFGGSDNMSGALAQSELFGILAREKVDLAFLWERPSGSMETAWQVYRNYDGVGGRFGERYFPIESAEKDLSIHAAKRSDGAWTVVLINQNLKSACASKLELPGVQGISEFYQATQESGGEVKLTPMAERQFKDKTTLNLPAASVSIFVVK